MFSSRSNSLVYFPLRALCAGLLLLATSAQALTVYKHVDAQGNANQPVLAPRLKESDFAGRSLMIHAGGDNHADHPAPLGGGGARLVCGVVK